MELFAQALPALTERAAFHLTLLIAASCGAAAVGFAVLAAFLASMARTVSRCRLRNRTIEPGAVWFAIVPPFGLVYWNFVIAGGVSGTLEREFKDRGWHRPGATYGGAVGRAWGLSGLAWLVAFLAAHVVHPLLVVAALLGLTHFVLFVLFWVAAVGYRREIEAAARPTAARPAWPESDD